LVGVHSFLARTISLFILAIALWGLYKFIRRQGPSPAFWGALAIGEGLIVIQVIIGIVMVIMGVMPYRTIHFLYGAVAVLLWPATYTFTQNQDERRQALYWFLVSLFMFAMLTLRAGATGGYPEV
jgi:heme A synthase